jgi:hypothetical protein
MSTGGNITQGDIIHVVYDNVAADPTNNYLSINNALTLDSNGRGARWFDRTYMGVFRATQTVGSGNPFVWATRDGNNPPNSETPIIQIKLTDDTVFGIGASQTGNVEDRHFVLTSTDKIREKLNFPDTHTFSGFSIQTAASTGGALGWAIKQGPTILAAGSIPQAAANYSTDPVWTSWGVFNWYDVELPSTLTLTGGTVYTLEFTPSSGSVWRFAAQRNTGLYNFEYPASNRQTQSELLANSSWQLSNINTHSSSGNGFENLRFVLHKAA